MSSRTSKSQAQRRAKPKWVKWLRVTFIVGFVFAVVGFVVGSIIWKNALAKAAIRVQNMEDLLDKVAREPSTIISDDGKELFTFAAENRKPVHFDEVPDIVKFATLAAEDKRFYEHSGIDGWALARSLLTNVKEGRAAQGASTLTMQLAKRLYTSPQKTFNRKVEDMALAVMIEREKTKDQILELYLNEAYYGSGAYGIQAAAEVYFNKSLDRLTVSEAATLARCVRRPSSENPYANLKKSLDNRNVVLATMLDEKMITRTQYDKAVREKLKLRRSSKQIVSSAKDCPYFVDYVLDQVRDEFPGIDLSEGGYRVETTINTKLQAEAEDAVRKLVKDFKRQRVTTGAFVLLDRDGRILAMVGGVDYQRNQFNMISQGRRQPGSSFKPFVYSAALDRGDITPDSTISNERLTYTDSLGRKWSPQNSGGKYGGSVRVGTAIALSMNVPAVRVCEKVGPSTAVEYCQSIFGFKSKLEPYLPLVLGASAVSPLEMAQGYSVFMLHGDRFTPFGIKRILSPDGTVLKDYSPNVQPSGLRTEVAEQMDEFLRGVVTRGTARTARTIINARGKTGTTSDNIDAWFIGYTDKFLGVGWIANERKSTAKNRLWDYSPMGPQVFGGTVTVKMWKDILQATQDELGEERRLIEDGGSGKKPHTDQPATDAPNPPAEQPEDWTLPPMDATPQPDSKPPAGNQDGSGGEVTVVGTVSKAPTQRATRT